MFKIDTSLPPPGTPKRGRKAAIYPFSEMVVGDSFWVPPDMALKARLSAAARKVKHEGWDYTSRADGDGLRIWRTA